MEYPAKTDYYARGDNKAHKFGVELKENTQFHHTKTDEDGVRMGCYGHIENGKKFSTYYVADARGYRLVPHQDYVTVYPEFNAERKASFVQEFDVDERNSQNIRHFFPTACRGPELGTLVLPEISTTTRRPPVVRTRATTPSTFVEPSPIPIIPNEIDPIPSDSKLVPSRSGLRNENSRTSTNNVLPRAENGRNTQSCSRTAHLRFPENNRNDECCSYDNYASLVVPIPLDKFTQGDVDSVAGLQGDNLLLKVLEIFNRN